MIGDYDSPDLTRHIGALLGEVSDLEGNIVRFPQHVGMTPAEREEFYAVWRKWIVRDDRTSPGLRLDDGR